MKWIEGPVACDSGSIARRLRPRCHRECAGHSDRRERRRRRAGAPLTSVNMKRRPKHTCTRTIGS